MYENKMKELETELSQKSLHLAELKQQLKELKEQEERAQTNIWKLQDEVRAKQQSFEMKFTLNANIGDVT